MKFESHKEYMRNLSLHYYPQLVFFRDMVCVFPIFTSLSHSNLEIRRDVLSQNRTVAQKARYWGLIYQRKKNLQRETLQPAYCTRFKRVK